MLLLVAFNEFMLGVETFVAHLISGTIVTREWIPIVFGLSAGVLLLIAGLIAVRHRTPATIIATVVFVASIVVGLLGAFYHLVRAAVIYAPFGEQVSVPLLVWAPPILGPLTFALAGLLGLSAAFLEDPTDSGSLRLFGRLRLNMPLSKTRGYLLLVSLGSLATVISSVLDHARTDFSNPWLWIATGIGVFATVVAFGLATVSRPTRADVWNYIVAMALLMLAGILGGLLHVLTNTTDTGHLVIERFIRGAPPLAPMLFADIGLIGLVVLLDPREQRQVE